MTRFPSRAWGIGTLVPRSCLRGTEVGLPSYSRVCGLGPVAGVRRPRLPGRPEGPRMTVEGAS